MYGIAFVMKNEKIFQIRNKSDVDRVHAVVMTWRIQKNRKNGQQIRLLVDRDHPEVCPALAIANMAWRKARLRHPMSKSLAVFKDKREKYVMLRSQK